jgi:hypothetical protein
MSTISLPKRVSLLSAADQSRSLNAPLERTREGTGLSESLLFWFHEDSEDLNRTDSEIIIVAVLPELAKANYMNFV